MKLTTINQRRLEKSKRSEQGKFSKYAQKISLQKKGIFSNNSPFIPCDTGLNLTEFNRIRFKKK